jgi:hypothetical protein
MNSYKVKVSVLEWMIHIFALFFAFFLAAFVTVFKEKPGPSFEQAVIHIILVACMILDLFILYKKLTAFIELDSYSLRYRNFNTSLQINLTDITKIERTRLKKKALTLHAAGKAFIIPLNIENKDDFLNNLVNIIETINYRIEFDKENLLNLTKKEPA